MSTSRIRKRVRVGLALSGGGGRGLAQVGVLKSLERAGISIDVIAGTSIGAIIGGVYACWPDAAELEKRVLAFVRSKYIESLNLATIRRLGGISMIGEEEPEQADAGVFDRVQTAFRGLYASHLALSRRAVLSGERVQRVLETVFDGRTFEDTEIPFGAVAVDLHEGCEVIIGSGPLARGVAASSAIPGIFPPVELNGRLLCDGGYTSPVPIDAVKTLGANVAIAVDVSQHGIAVSDLANGVEIAMRSTEISLMALEQEQLRRADVVISARGQERHWSDFSRPEEAIRAGEVACEKLLDSVRGIVEERARLFL
jgi:NTE family protein